MDLPPLTYLSFDSLSEGVGASQVTPYVERIATRDMQITLHSLEKTEPAQPLRDRLRSAGIHWVPHAFGRPGSSGGIARVLRAARWVRGADLVHARSDLAAASCLLGRPEHWLWDVRGLWADERIELGALATGSPQEKVMRRIESASARQAGAAVTLSAAIVSELARRHGPAIREKVFVVTTCVDLERFELTGPLPLDPAHLVLSGTLNTRYDVPAMIRLANSFAKRCEAVLDVVRPVPSTWDGILAEAGARLSSSSPADMPQVMARATAGLCLLTPGRTRSSLGSMPTKLGEFLSSGRPVVVSAGLGDMPELLARHSCGVVVEDRSDEGLDAAAEALYDLAEDGETPKRCRALAEEHFDLDRGVDRLISAYRHALAA